jgi:hypothetical protein
MKTIYKYPLDIADYQSIKIPQDANILSILYQGEILVLYALIETEKPLELRGILIEGTGNPFPESESDNIRFIGTVQSPFGYVWHVFCEEKNK